MACHATRTVATLEGLCHFALKVRRCETPACPLYHQPYRPEDESAVALPHGESGLDVIALIGALRYTQHRSVPEMHRDLCGRGVRIAERTVTDLLQRYEELVALRNSRNRYGGYAPSSARSKTAQIRRRRPSGAIAWRCAAH